MKCIRRARAVRAFGRRVARGKARVWERKVAKRLFMLPVESPALYSGSRLLEMLRGDDERRRRALEAVSRVPDYDGMAVRYGRLLERLDGTAPVITW